MLLTTTNTIIFAGISDISMLMVTASGTAVIYE
jgi:uncharacterized protein YbjQ (UPF0145 family)